MAGRATLMTDEERATQVEQRLRQVEQQLFTLDLEKLDPGREEEADKAEVERLTKFADALDSKLTALRVK